MKQRMQKWADKKPGTPQNMLMLQHFCNYALKVGDALYV